MPPDAVGLAQGDDRTIIALNPQDIAFAPDAVAEYGIDPNYFDPADKGNGAASQAAHAHNESYAEHLTSLGEDSSMRDGQQMTELTGSRHYMSGLYMPGTVMVQPAGYIRGLAAGRRLVRHLGQGDADGGSGDPDGQRPY